MIITIPGSLPSLNEYIQKERTNKFLGAKMKREATDLVTLIAKLHRPKTPYKAVYVRFYWYVKNAKKDPDNIAFAKKFILDGLVQAGVIENDGWNNILGFTDELYIDKNDQRIVVSIEESK